MVKGFQVKALCAKSWAYQRKNVCMNVCVLLAPIVITALLGVLQMLLNNLLSSEAQCGCECLECAITAADGTETTTRDSAACNNIFRDPDAPDIKCTARNKSNCSAEFSDPEQVEWCAIEQPSQWAPIFDLNNALNLTDSSQESGESNREASGSSPSPTGHGLSAEDDYATADDELLSSEPIATSTEFMYTGESAFGDAAMQRLVRTPDLELLINDTGIASEVEMLSESSLISTYDLRFLVQLGWDFGSEQRLSGNIHSDAAFLESPAPLSIVPDCAALQQQLQPILQQFSLNSSIDRSGSDTTSEAAGTLLEPLLRNCASTSLKQMGSTGEIDDELYCTFSKNTEKVCGERRVFYASAFDWKASQAGSLNVDVYENDVNLLDGDGIVSRKRISKPIDRVVNAFLQEWLGEGYHSRLLALTDMPKPGSIFTWDLSSSEGPLFFLWLVQLPLPSAVVQLVYEKQHRLRSMMRMHGLSNDVYLLVMYLYFVFQYMVYVIIMIAAGVAAGLGFFKSNDYGVQIVFYFLYGNMQVAFAFLLSCFLTNTRTANVACWIWVLGSGLFAHFLMPNVFAAERWWANIVQFVPTVGAFRGLWELGEYAQRASYQGSGAVGMRFEDINRDGTGMGAVWLIFVVEWGVFMALAWYLEQVLSSATGIRRHWLFPLHSTKAFTINVDPLTTGPKSGLVEMDLGADVLRERDRAYSVNPGEENPIVLRDLKKEFPAEDGNPKKVAVSNMSVSVARGECFGLLGPNGAGKSTSINMMIGFLEATEGEAIINGRNIKTDMNEIYSFMGVCPQDNLLWETLTAREHLFFYARLKCLSGDALTAAVDATLKSVNLFDVGNKRAGQFSGGMKRRLSCAISLIGEPAVTYLDEPSTGLDPASRRQLWATIAGAKHGKAVVLTTHSMEEAEALCDRLGIFVDGKLACIGPPKALAARYGGYHVFTITTPESQLLAAQALVHSMSPNSKRTYTVAGTSKWRLPMEDVSLSKVFDTMSTAAENGLTVLDWGVQSASLEDVFIQVAQEASKNKDTEVVQIEIE